MDGQGCKVIKVKHYRIKVPASAIISEGPLCLDDIFHSSESHADLFLGVKCSNRTYAIIIEDAGVPEVRDFKKLEKSVTDLASRGYVLHEAIVVKLLHHRGLGSGKGLLRSLARSYRVELQECNKTIDLGPVLERVG